jgi:hypothetical protein
MRIPSGDLAPARKHRRYGRRRSPVPVVVAVLLVVAVAAGAYLLRREDSNAGTVTARPSPCATISAPTPAAAVPVRLPAPGQVRLRLLNGTGRDGLARAVGNELARRGFLVSAMGNAPAPVAGASRVAYGQGGRPAALLVSAHVLGAAVVPAPALPAGSVDAVLGSSFVRLRTAPEVTAYARRLASPARPVAAPSSACR